jgi:flagellar hook protein FlgE
MIALTSALDGLARSEAQFNQAARSIARAPLAARPTDTVDLSTAAVGLLTARNNFETNTQLIKISNELEQSLINTLG